MQRSRTWKTEDISTENILIQDTWIEEKEKELVLKYLKSEEGDAREAINSWQGRAMHRKEIREIDRVMDQVTCSPADFGRWVAGGGVLGKDSTFFMTGKGEKHIVLRAEKPSAVRMRSVHNRPLPPCPNCGREGNGKILEQAETDRGQRGSRAPAENTGRLHPQNVFVPETP